MFHIATHKVCPEQSSVILSLIRKQITLVKAMRSLYLLCFFVLFGSLHPSWDDHVIWDVSTCGPFFELREGNVVGRGFKNFDNYTVCRQVVNHDNCIHPDEIIIQIFKVYEGMREREEVYELRVQSNRKEVQFERGIQSHRSSRQVWGLQVLYLVCTDCHIIAMFIVTSTTIYT